MSFTIKHGLFKSNITDYHAILGISLNADPKTIRLKYLRTAQKLHPDTCKGNAKEKKLASQLLSKLINPAYKELSNKTQFAEHQLVLTQIGKRHAEKSDRMTVASEPAKKLLQANKNIDRVYEELLKEITVDQYKNIDKILTKIAMISELNFVYLIAKNKQVLSREDGKVQRRSPKPSSPSTQKPQDSKTKPQSSTQTPQDSFEELNPQSRVESYIRRAKEYMEKGDMNQAISELRDGLRIDPSNCICHALMGKAYLHQNQLTMAKVHINKAHEVNSKDPTVIHSKELLEKLLQKQQRRSARSSTKSSEKKKSNDSGFFSGFFGAKKK